MECRRGGAKGLVQGIENRKNGINFRRFRARLLWRHVEVEVDHRGGSRDAYKVGHGRSCIHIIHITTGESISPWRRPSQWAEQSEAPRVTGKLPIKHYYLTSSMRELLEKAHQQDEEDIFKEEEGDEEFSAPRM